MNKQRKTSNILNVFQYDETTGAVTLPSTLVLTAPTNTDNSTKVPTTAWTRSYVSGLNYLTGNQTITVSGDASGSGTTSINLTLTNTAVTPGTYGSTTLVPVVTVDSKGRITSVTTAAISGALTFTGDVTGTGTTGTSTALTLANSGVTAGTYTKVTVDLKGRITVGASATTSDIAEGTNLYYTDARVLAYLGANNYATQSYVGTQIANLVASAPLALDTLNELAAALGNDANFATTTATSLGNRLRIDIGTQGLTTTQQGYGRTNLGLGTAATSAIGDFATAAQGTKADSAYGWGNHASAGYLTSATAASTYLTQTSASNTYLTLTNATATYLSQTSAASTYLTLTNAASTYLSQTSAASTYLTLTNASSTYLTQASASSNYVSLSGSYANPSWITSLAYSKITGVPAFLTSYTETDTLANVTSRGASTSTAVTFSGGASISSLLINGATAWTEGSLALGAHSADEGGQLVLNKATSYTYAAHIDVWHDVLRFLYGTNTATSGVAMSLNLSTKQLILPQYNASNVFTGTAAGVLAFDSSGNILTIAVPGGAVSSVNAGTGVSVNSNTGAVTVSIGQSVATSATPTFDQVITSNNGNGTNFRIGDDVWIGDINAANTFRIQGVQNAANGYIVFGNGDATALGRASTGALTYGGNTVYHAGNLTNLNQLTNGPGYITGITSANVTTALGFTPYNSTNPNGYISGNQSITLSGDVTGSGTTSITTTVSAYFDQRVYTRADNYLGGYYDGAGNNKPNNSIFNAGKLKIAMLNNTNLGFGGPWNDVLWISTYTGSDVKQSHALVFDKYSADVWVSDQNYDATGWGTGYKLYHTGNLTNLNQLTNGPGYITSYTETDTLASVTARGATTSSNVRFGAYADISPTGSAFRFYDGTTFRGGFGTDAWGHSGSDANLVLYVNGDNTLFFSTSGTKRASLSSSAFNSLVALQQSGNQVLHAGNYSSYAFPASGGTLNGYLTVSANWGASPYTSALTIIGTYPSITFRGSNSDYEWLQHVDSAGVFHFYGGPGYTVNSWNQKLSIKTSGQLILKNHSTADSGYDNPLWIWATQDSDAIVIQNTTSGGNAPKIYFRDTNGIIQTGNSEIRLRTSNSNSYSAYLSGGDWYATGSMRAPIFYDSNDTTYYLDPNSTSNVNAITMGGTLYMNGGAYYGTIIFGSSTYWRAGISQRDAGNAELRIWAKGGGAGSIYFATGFDGEASATTLPSDGMALKNNNLGLGNWGVSEFPSYKLHVKGTGYATSDFRAPIFYDSNDTNYYLDPNGGSVLSTTRTALKAARGLNGYGGGSWVDDFTNTPISSMTFGEDKYSGGPSGTWWFQVNMRHQNSSNIWGTQLAYGWEDNANRMMQRNVTGGTWSAWVEYINSSNIGSQSVSYASTAGSANSVAWGNVSGRPSALSQFSNDSGYITGVTNISGNAGSANVATYARRIDGVSRVQITVGGNASTFYPVAISTGAGSTSQQYSEFVIERGGYDDPGYTGVGFSTFNARFSYKPSGWGYGAVYWNLEQLGQTTTMLADYDDYYQASQFVVWLRGATTYWLWSVVGGIGVIFENTSGTSYNATYRTFGTTTTVAAKASVSRNFYGNLRLDNNIYSGGSLISGYNVELGGSDAGNVVLSTYNNRNLRLTGTGGSDVGICGRRSGGSFGFQLYGEGTAYGFLNYEWGAWNLKKVISGALYMNDNNSYYINTTGDSSFSGALTLGGTLTVAGVSTLNAQVYINRHIDANTTWGSAGVNSIFVGWGSGKVILGNGNSGGHDYANGLGGNTVVSTNPFYCYQDITAYSDSRVKENVEVVDNAVEKIKAIRGVTFTRNDVEDKNKRHAGVIAQEVLAVLPEAVSEDLNGHYSVAYGNLNALLIEAIKEQQKQIEELQNKLDNVLSSR